MMGDHTNVDANDELYFLLEYTSGRDYSFSRANQLIANLKKKPSRPEKELYWKGRAISQCSVVLSTVLNSAWLDIGTLVPVPCSKAKGHPDYDDRLTRVCRGIRPAKPPNVRELVIQTKTLDASHEAEQQGKMRATVAELLDVYSIDEALAQPTPASIVIVDDMLTVGTHYRAMHTILRRRFSNTPIAGLFITRRVFPSAAEDFEDLPD